MVSIVLLPLSLVCNAFAFIQMPSTKRFAPGRAVRVDCTGTDEVVEFGVDEAYDVVAADGSVSEFRHYDGV
jgi:hypothetical protein